MDTIKPPSREFPEPKVSNETVLIDFFSGKNPNLLSSQKKKQEIKDCIQADCRGLAVLLQDGSFLTVFNSYPIAMATGKFRYPSEWAKDSQAVWEDKIRQRWYTTDDPLDKLEDGTSVIIYMFSDQTALIQNWQVIATKWKGEWWFPYLNM